jgi:NADP-dependent 3-hydroxy acid dehydrogenase YdfG
LYNPVHILPARISVPIEEGNVKDLKDKVAVITGAASGIGRAIAERCGQEGMKVVIADVEKGSLRQTAKEIKAEGVEVMPVLTNVSKYRDVERLAKKTLDAYGSVDLLFNNAGVTTGTVIWESTLADWKWLLGVNLWGVIHGIRVFVPIMLKQDTECHIVNTASMAALISYPGRGIYTVTKHAVLALSEKLYHELGRLALESGMPPQQVVDCVFSAIREDKFYIITHPEMKPLLQLRADDIMQERNPTNPFADMMPPAR